MSSDEMEYELTNRVRFGTRTMDRKESLVAAGVADGDELELQ